MSNNSGWSASVLGCTLFICITVGYCFEKHLQVVEAEETTKQWQIHLSKRLVKSKVLTLRRKLCSVGEIVYCGENL